MLIDLSHLNSSDPHSPHRPYRPRSSSSTLSLCSLSSLKSPKDSSCKLIILILILLLFLVRVAYFSAQPLSYKGCGCSSSCSIKATRLFPLLNHILVTTNITLHLKDVSAWAFCCPPLSSLCLPSFRLSLEACGGIHGSCRAMTGYFLRLAGDTMNRSRSRLA